MMPIDLVLVRHGESEGNIATKKSKKGDDTDYTEEFLNRHSSLWRLTDKGKEQARVTGKWIQSNISMSFDRYLTSEYARAKETAALLGFSNAQWRSEFYLREREWGELDVMTYKERLERFAKGLEVRKKNRLLWIPPNGESMAQLCIRIDRTLNSLHRECSNKRVLIVCHGDIIWAFRIRLEHIPQIQYQKLIESKNPFDRIHNGQILHYTRRNPEKYSQVKGHMGWVKSFCPNNPDLSLNKWEEIKRKTYSNEELLAEVEQIPRLIAG